MINHNNQVGLSVSIVGVRDGFGGLFVVDDSSVEFVYICAGLWRKRSVKTKNCSNVFDIL